MFPSLISSPLFYSTHSPLFWKTVQSPQNLNTPVYKRKPRPKYPPATLRKLEQKKIIKKLRLRAIDWYENRVKQVASEVNAKIHSVERSKAVRNEVKMRQNEIRRKQHQESMKILKEQKEIRRKASLEKMLARKDLIYKQKLTILDQIEKESRTMLVYPPLDDQHRAEMKSFIQRSFNINESDFDPRDLEEPQYLAPPEGVHGFTFFTRRHFESAFSVPLSYQLDVDAQHFEDMFGLDPSTPQGELASQVDPYQDIQPTRGKFQRKKLDPEKEAIPQKLAQHRRNYIDAWRELDQSQLPRLPALHGTIFNVGSKWNPPVQKKNGPVWNFMKSKEENSEQK